MRKKNNIADSTKTKSILSLRKYISVMKRLFIFWIIISVIIVLLNVGISAVKSVSTGRVSTIVNLSFNGIESGFDPNGNKFDISDMKSDKIIRETLEELGYTDLDPELISGSITIDGVIPTDVIERIIAYTPQYESETVSSSQNIQDTSYYPTQYKIEIICEKVEITHKEAANILNKITEKYYDYFYNTYGYNTSLEKAVTSINYDEYDYVDSLTIFDSSLRSLQNYINELSSSDNTRFRSENGYTFADISASIDTICNEDLDLISSYVMINNITKNKKNLIANYEFKVEDMKRKKKTAEETIASINETIDAYEKDSIIILGNATDTSSASLTQSSQTYNNLITQKIDTQTVLSRYEQNINLYNERLKSLKSDQSLGSNNKYVEQELEKISSKINTLIDTINDTASEYYEKVFLNNAYTVLTPADASMIALLKNALSDSIRNIITFQLILTSAYLTLSGVFCFVKLPERFGKRSEKKQKEVKNKKRR